MTIEELLIAYLSDNVDVGVFAERPKSSELPSSYILIEKLGGGEENHVRTANIAIQSIAPTLLEAIKLNEQVISIMPKMYGYPNIVSVAYNTDYNFTDTSTKEYKYQALYDIKYI